MKNKNKIFLKPPAFGCTENRWTIIFSRRGKGVTYFFLCFDIGFMWTFVAKINFFIKATVNKDELSSP